MAKLHALLASPAASVAWKTCMLILFGSMATFVALILTGQVEFTRSLMAVPASIVAAISFAELLLHAAKPKETKKAFPLNDPRHRRRSQLLRCAGARARRLQLPVNRRRVPGRHGANRSRNLHGNSEGHRQRGDMTKPTNRGRQTIGGAATRQTDTG